VFVNAGGTLNVGSGAVDVGRDLTVKTGGILDLDLGTLDAAGDVLIGSNNKVYATYDGTQYGTLHATSNLTVSSGVTWNIDAGDVFVTNNAHFDFVSSSTMLDHQLTTNDVKLTGSKVIGGWLARIDSLDEINGGLGLRATYRMFDIDVALGVSGETSTEFGKLASDLTLLLPIASPGYIDFAFQTNSAAGAAELLTNSYFRATEMASSLVRLQSIISEQIKDRTRSRLRYQGVGYPSAARPSGSAGWDAMRDFSDRMEDNFGYDEIKDAVDAVVPDFNVNVMDSLDRMTPDVKMDVKGAVDAVVPEVQLGGMEGALPDVKLEKITLPTVYRVWGRGYGSFNEQKTVDGFVGYDATIGGGVVGIDRQIDNMLVGIAGGYARTALDGYAGKDGSSDTGHATAYFSAYGRHAFIDANATYAYNGVDTEYRRLGYTGNYVAHTAGFYLGGGYAFAVTKDLLLTPEASILSSLYTRDSYTESSELYPDLLWDAYDQWSHLGTIGGTLSLIHYIELRDSEMLVQPEVRLHLLHEFNNEFDDETYTMGGQFDYAASLKAHEEDLIRVGGGVRMASWASDATEVGIDVDATFGDNYSSYIVSGKIMHRF